MNRDRPDWLHLQRGDAPLLLSLPHTGTFIPTSLARRLSSTWLATKDIDWHVDRIYDFASELGMTVVRTSIARTVIDVNREPTGASLYPGQNTTELCPTTTFDGEPLYEPGSAPDEPEVSLRRATWFDPYHSLIEAELARLRSLHRRVVLYDAHSIRSVIPRLFEGELPHFNIGTNGGVSCDPALTQAVESVLDTAEFTHVTNGRFRGGYITRFHGRPDDHVHAIQMEIAIRTYLHEPDRVTEQTWPPPLVPNRALACSGILKQVLAACLAFASSASPEPHP